MTASQDSAVVVALVSAAVANFDLMEEQVTLSVGNEVVIVVAMEDSFMATVVTMGMSCMPFEV